MKLRAQLLTLSLATVLVPWFGWKLVQELEEFLRAGQERALLASARTVAQALPPEYQSLLLFGRDRALPLRALDSRPIIDGYQDDWPESGQALEFSSADGRAAPARCWPGVLPTSFPVLPRDRCHADARTDPRRPGPGSAQRPARRGDGLMLYLRSARGLNHFRIQTAAPGPLVVASQTDGGGQLRGYWQDIAGGYQRGAGPAARRALYRPEPRRRGRSLLVPAAAVAREAGTLQAGRAASWLTPAQPAAGSARWLQRGGAGGLAGLGGGSARLGGGGHRAGRPLPIAARARS